MDTTKEVLVPDKEVLVPEIETCAKALKALGSSIDSKCDIKRRRMMIKFVMTNRKPYGYQYGNQ